MLAESYFSQNRLADRLSAIADQMQMPELDCLAIEHGTSVFTNHYTLNMTKLGALHASSLINTPARVAIYEWSFVAPTHQRERCSRPIQQLCLR
jgi:hypothetical protein